MNKGINKANGQWCLFLNSGDYFSSNYSLPNIFKNLPNEDFNVISGKVDLYYKDKFILKYGGAPLTPHQATLTKTEILKKNKFNQDYKILGDIELSKRTSHLHKVFFTNETVANFGLGGVGNHPRFFLQRYNEYKLVFTSLKSRIIYFTISTISYLYWRTLGEEKYYEVFTPWLINFSKKRYENKA